MASEQAHGTEFERVVLAQSGLQVPDTFVATSGGMHDIPQASTGDAIPVSIKAVQWDINHPSARPTVALADARRFFHATTHDALRMVIGLHHPTPTGPLIYEIHECTTIPTMHQGLWGELTAATIAAFAQAIKTWAQEDDVAGIVGRKRACERARQHKRTLLAQMGHVDLSPKISAQEARLQCAIPLFALRRECLNAGSTATIHSMLNGDTAWRNIPLPFALAAGGRTRRAHTG